MNLITSIKEGLGVWKKVFGNFKYLSIVLAVAFLFYAFNVFVSNPSAISSFYSGQGFFEATYFLWTLMVGFGGTIKLHSYISILLISLLLGILFSLIVYKINLVGTPKIKNKKAGFFAITGTFLGVFAPGCAACGVGLASLLGISTAALTFLPFDGLELSIAAIGLISFSIVRLTKNFSECDVCKISIDK